MSVRLDPATARDLVALADRKRVSPSALLRQWAKERVDAESVGSPAKAIGEAAPDYTAPADQYETLRQRYRPTRIKTLLVGESRPAGGTFFYLADSRLFFATREAFVRGRGSAPYGQDFLLVLQREGIWLYDLASAPVNRLAGRPRRDAVAERTADLVALLRETNPERVVVIKRSLEAVVRAAIEAAGVEPERLIRLPFPLYQWREPYVAGLARVFAPESEDEP